MTGRGVAVTFLSAWLLTGATAAAEPPAKNVVPIAGAPDFNYPKGTHEYAQSVRLLQHWLDTSIDCKVQMAISPESRRIAKSVSDTQLDELFNTLFGQAMYTERNGQVTRRRRVKCAQPVVLFVFGRRPVAPVGEPDSW